MFSRTQRQPFLLWKTWRNHAFAKRHNILRWIVCIKFYWLLKQFCTANFGYPTFFGRNACIFFKTQLMTLLLSFSTEKRNWRLSHFSRNVFLTLTFLITLCPLMSFKNSHLMEKCLLLCFGVEPLNFTPLFHRLSQATACDWQQYDNKK